VVTARARDDRRTPLVRDLMVAAGVAEARNRRVEIIIR
jgi:hypothetical protein